jgi:hypothetical protein
MNASYPPAQIPATPEYVLDLLRDVFRGWDQPDDFLSFDTTVSDFASEWNDTILWWRELARALNGFTGLDLPLAQWRPVLAPMGRRTVGEVCRFVAENMRTRPAIRPWRHVAGECLPAGAFLTARWLLSQRGADPRAIAPSTPLCEYLTRYGPGWVLDLMWMAPARVPPVARRDRLGAAGVACCLLGSGLAAVTRSPLLCGLTLTAALACWLVRSALPRRFAVGELTTFRDLAYALAGQPPRRPIQPTP